MEPLDFSRPSQIFIADDIIATAKELQSHLATISFDDQPAYAADALDVLGDPRELYHSKRLYIHALGAQVLMNGHDALSFDEQIYHGVYLGDAYFKAQFSRFCFIRSRVVSSLCLTLIDATVLSSTSNPEFEGESIRSGVYVPVHSVETVLAA